MTSDRNSLNAHGAAGEFISFEGERYYRIAGYDHMPHFLMNIASDTDLWMFISSGGGLTAGRVDADGALFPYEAVDKLHKGHHRAGPVTLARVWRKGGESVLWEPFTKSSREDFRIERNLYKNIIGNRVIFEEINHDLELVFRYRWTGSDRFGHVRTATMENAGAATVSISLMDGLRNILPYGAPLPLYQQLSSLVDAYKRTDCDPETRLGFFSLTSRIIDRAEAAEELRANTAWCSTASEFEVCLSSDAVSAFRRGDAVNGETVLAGRKGNYLVMMSLSLEPGEKEEWHIVADVGKSHVQAAELRALLLKGGDLGQEVETSLAEASYNLIRNVGSADGIQLTGSEEASVHHFSNVLFNNMRGGVFARNYDIPTADLIDFIGTRSRTTAERLNDILLSLPGQVTESKLLELARETGDADFERLCHEYLPIYFGRRHGDPSRPWNRFSIHIKNNDGRRELRYEGNWRDIFQNWEALTMSFPGFLPGIIAKFVNASTVDGFNPYRITRDGVDWEITDPDDPWSYIGYWGDHQIIYLLKFLESLTRFYPGTLEEMLGREIFAYADVPYRIKPYEKILENPDETIDYDIDLARRIGKQVEAFGTDGKLLLDSTGSVHHVNLLEKLLVPVLAKLSNLVPDGGIWMNTQRPEWNDANNALVGNGLSMVTLGYLRRHLNFIADLLEGMENINLSVSTEVAAWFESLDSILGGERFLLDSEEIDDHERKRVLDLLGVAFSDYRGRVYSYGFSGKRNVNTARIARFCRTSLKWLDHAMLVNLRGDGLYNSYNILEISRDGSAAVVLPLYEMLEGQVAALSSGKIVPEEAVSLIAALFESDMYREDQHSFMLYPERELPSFLEKNVVPEKSVLSVLLLKKLVEAGDGAVIARDADGIYRFNGDFANASDLASALDRLAENELWASEAGNDRQAVLDLFEEVFDHRSFTGRSGTMYGYEGLGCIYWHMVSKLLLAVQEITLGAADEKSGKYLQVLTDYYYRIRSGLCFEKTVEEYGAFPADPYSHTPPHGGAQQPGMTGQVKEEILTRFGELGVFVKDGILNFNPILLKKEEFLEEGRNFSYYDIDGESRSIDLPGGSLAFTFCQMPVVYEITDSGPWIRITDSGGTSATVDGASLDREKSRSLFDRLGEISRIDVGIPGNNLR